MSGQSDDQEFSDVELSKTSDESNEHNTREEQALSTEPFLFSGLVPAAEPILLSGLISTDESSSTAEPGWTTEPTSSNQPPPTTQPMDSSSTRNSTYIHPISEGGSVTWTDHNGFVYHKGKDRGPRVPAPTLPDNYKSKGPLPNFPFHLLRGNNARKQPVTKFLDDYSGKQDQTPTELVTKILAYFKENEDSHIKYLSERSLKIQRLNDTIRVQELEISTIKEGLLETEAVKKYSAERGEKTKELDQNLKDREETINNLMLKIQELEEADRSIRDNETEELIKTYMLRIHELEEAERTRKAEGFMTSQEPDSTDRGERIKELDQNIKDREQTINALMLRIHELEEADRKRKQQRSTTSQDPAGSKPVPSVRKIIGNARAIEASLLESKVRIILLQAKGYIDNKEYPAAIEVISRAEDIMALELPSLEVLHGKVLYRKGRAQYELGFLPEAQQHFNKALKMGFDADCGEADGDCVRGWLDKARAAARASVRLGYPA